MTRRHRIAFVLLIVPVTTACRSLPATSCPPGQQAAVQELVYFGADRPSGQVTPGDWTKFLAGTVTPRFPAGLTTWQASGQWRSASGALVREPAYVLSLLHPGDAASERAVVEVTDAYKRQFQQEAVLRVRSTACMSL